VSYRLRTRSNSDAKLREALDRSTTAASEISCMSPRAVMDGGRLLTDVGLRRSGRGWLCPTRREPRRAGTCRESAVRGVILCSPRAVGQLFRRLADLSSSAFAEAGSATHAPREPGLPNWSRRASATSKSPESSVSSCISVNRGQFEVHAVGPVPKMTTPEEAVAIRDIDEFTHGAGPTDKSRDSAQWIE